MSDEATTQTDQTQQQTQQQPPAPEPTLEDVYKEAGSPPVDGVVTQPQVVQPAPVQQPQPAAKPIPVPPDPYDTEAHKAYLASLAQGTLATQQGLAEVARFLSQQQEREQKAALEQDISKAVTAVNEIVNHPKPKIIEAMLDAKARENPQFKALWNNRQRNPAAWSNALKVVAKEFASEFELKVDPKLVESQRALKASRQAMATTDREEQKSPLEEQLAKADGADFDALWNAAREG